MKNALWLCIWMAVIASLLGCMCLMGTSGHPAWALVFLAAEWASIVQMFKGIPE